MKTRLLCIVLVIVLCVGMLPVGALAAEEESTTEVLTEETAEASTEETTEEAPEETESPSTTETEESAEETTEETVEETTEESVEDTTEETTSTADAVLPDDEAETSEVETAPEAEEPASQLPLDGSSDGTAATSGTCGENLTWTLADGVLTISGTGAMEDYSWNNTPWYSERESITSVVISDGVTSIGDFAFYACYSLTSVAIPDSVTIVGDEAFGSCSSLESVTIPDRVTSIGNYAFYGCSKLTDVYYAGSMEAWSLISIGSNNTRLTSAFINGVASGSCGDNVTWTLDKESGTLTISGTGAMKYYRGESDVPWYSHRRHITSVVIEDGVTSICDDAFYNYTSLTSVTIPDSVTSIGNSAFYYCTKLTDITIPNSLTTIGNRTFESCTKITSVTIPASVTSIGNYAFKDCSSLANVYITDLTAWCNISFGRDCNPMQNGANLYINGELATEITIPDGITSIGNGVFRGCKSLESITIPDGVTSIGDYAFYNCTSLESITIPDGVTSIGEDAFYGCSKLTDVYYAGSMEAWSLISIGSYNTRLTDAFINGVASGTCGDSLTWKLIKESGVLTVSGDGDMEDYEYAYRVPWRSLSDYIESVVIEDGVTSISDNAFSECTSLTSVTILDGVTSIGEQAFEDCVGLVHVVISDSVASIEYAAFRGCTSLTSVTIGNGVTSIGQSAFADCTSLTSATIPKSVTSIGSYAFTDLTAVYITDLAAWCSIVFRYESCNPMCYGADLYINGELASEIVIPNDVTSIGAYAFCGCKSIKGITIPASVNSIGSYAFQDCDNLSDVYITDLASWCSVTFADTYSHPMRNGANLYINGELATEITIPDGVTSIGSWAFYGCSSLTSVTIPDGVTSIGRNAFSDCSNLVTVTLGKGVTTIEWCAFSCPKLTSVTYAGTEEDWDAIDIDGGNYTLTSAYLNGLNSGSCGDNLTWSLDNGTLTISGTGKMTDYSESNTSPWHRKCDTITSVIIEDGVTSIGSYAFYDCEALVSVTIPESVASIGASAFTGCSKLKSITYSGDSWDAIKIDDGNTRMTYLYDRTHTTKYAGFAASGTCGDDLVWTLTKAGSLSIYGTGEMEDYSYVYDERPPWAYKSITTVSIGEGVTSIGDCAFEDCSNLTNVTIGGDVERIGEYAFSWCTKLTSLTLPASLTNVGGNAFESSTKLTSFIVDPNNTAYTAVDGVLFSKDMTTLICCPGGYTGAYTIPTGVVTIGDSAFSGGNGITSVVIPEGVTTIEDYAFVSHSSLASITIPASVEEIGQGAFDRCTSLTSVTYTGTKEEWNAIVVRDYNTPLLSAFINGEASGTCGDNLTWTLTATGVLTISGTGEMKINAENAPWYAHRSSIATVVIEDGVTGVGDWVFYECEALVSVTIPESVTSIGEGAFSGCKSLANITIPAGVTSIGERAFFDCTSLASITIPGTVTSIESETFYRCESLEIVTIGTGVTSIGWDAFEGCASLTSIAIPDSVTSIKGSAFFLCTSLASITIPDSVTSIGWGAFYGCSSLTSITIPDGITSIESVVFCNCESLTSITIPDSVTSIEDSAFSGCSSLTNIVIPDDVAIIDEGTFLGCSSLTSITISSSVTSIGTRAFYDCSALTDVYYAGTQEEWDSITIKSDNTCLTTATLHILTAAEKVAATLDSIDEAASPDDIRDAVQEIGVEDLAKALEDEDSGVLEKLGELEESVKSGEITVTTDNQVDSVKCVSVTGAALNDLAEDNTDNTITLTITAADAAALPEEFSAEGAVYLNITLEGVANPHELEVPVVLTLAVPEDMNTSLLRIIHYKEDADGKVVDVETLVPTVFQGEDGQWYARVVVTGFSRFVLAQLARIPGDFNGDGDVTIIDVLALLKHVAGISTVTGNADVSGDGQVNIMDVLHLLKFVARIIPSL